MNPWGPVAVIVFGYLIGFLWQNKRLDDLEKRIVDKFAALEKRVDDKIDALEKRMDIKFENLEKRLDRLEHPVYRP